MSARNEALQALKARRQGAAAQPEIASGSATSSGSPSNSLPRPGGSGTASPARPAAQSAPAAAGGGASGSAAQRAPAAARPTALQEAAPAPALPRKSVEAFAWLCTACNRECVPVRSESRCLCGHRLKEHGPACASAPSKCKNGKCRCSGFFFVVAEGAWVLRCRCKHKHVEHDPATRACIKAGCGCGTFDSPWVCNCDHPWSAHQQLVVTKEVISVTDMMTGLTMEEAIAGPAPEVNNYDGLRRGGL